MSEFETANGAKTSKGAASDDRRNRRDGGGTEFTRESLTEMFANFESLASSGTEDAPTAAAPSSHATPQEVFTLPRDLQAIINEEEHRTPPGGRFNPNAIQLLKQEVADAIVEWTVGREKFAAANGEVPPSLPAWATLPEKNEVNEESRKAAKKALAPFWNKDFSEKPQEILAALRSSPVATVRAIINAVSPQQMLGVEELPEILKGIRSELAKTAA